MRSIPVTLAACVAAWSVSMAASAETLAWQFNPEAELGFEANDNYRLLLPGQTIEGVNRQAVGGYATAALQIRGLDDVDDVKFTPAVRGTDFPDSSNNNSTDPELTFDWTHKGQTWSSNIDASYAKQRTVETLSGTTTATAAGTSTVGTAPGTQPGGLGNPNNNDAGIVDFNVRQQTINITPTFDVQVSARNHIEAQGNFVDVSFGTNTPASTVGFKNYGGSLGLEHDLTQRDQLTLRSLYAHNDPDSLPAVQGKPLLQLPSTDSYGLEGEWTRKVTQISQFYLRLGDERSTFGTVGGIAPPSQNTWVAGAGVNWTFQVTQLFLDATRTVSPSVIGLTVEEDQLRFRLVRDFSARLSAQVTAAGLIDKGNGSTAALAGFRERKYATSSLGLKWRLNRSFTLAAGYTYIWQRFQNDFAAAQSNGGTLSIIWEPNKDRNVIPGQITF